MLSAALVGAALTGAALTASALTASAFTACAAGCAATPCIGASATITAITPPTALIAAPRSARSCALAIAAILAHLTPLRARVRRVMHLARMSLVTPCLLLACGDPPADTSAATTSATSTGPTSSTSTTSEPTTTEPTTGTTTSPDLTTTTDPTTTDPDLTTTGPGTTDLTTGQPLLPVPLRALFINVGNASPQYGCWEYKLCRPQDVLSVREYIATWRPDVIALSEVLRAEQLTGAIDGGPILPDGYAGVCGDSRDRRSGQLAAWDADDASHQHECIAWNTARLALVPGGTASVYGAQGCDYDFTGFRARLLLDGAHELALVAVHPNSTHVACRTQEIARYWSELALGPRVLMGGDWNSDSDDELQRPPGFDIAYLRGQHWDIVLHDDEYSAEYGFGFKKEKYDHAFVNFGGPLTAALPFGSALGGHDDHPRADGGGGFDHRQLLVDLEFDPAGP